MVYSHIKELENTSKRMFFTYNLMDIHEDERKQVLELEKIELNTEKLEELKTKACIMIKSYPVRLSAVKNGHPKSQSGSMATPARYRRTPSPKLNFV
jgi:hypothetical protein